MASGQQWLFAPEKPLVKRLGKKFFREIPRQAGIYKMRDARDNIVYVGKARNLRQRLRNYRVANPERMPRRHLRMLREVSRIEFDLCPNERDALKREARLIRELKPRYNRAGVWPGRTQFLTWRFVGSAAEFAVQEIPAAGWERFGPLGAYASRLRSSLVRLLWLAMNPDAGFHRLPYGWSAERLKDVARIECVGQMEQVRTAVDNTFWGEPEVFTNWLTASLNQNRSAFECAAILADVEELQEFFKHQNGTTKSTAQMVLL